MNTTQIAASNGTVYAIVPLDPKEVGQRLANARRSRGYTQLTFAIEIGVSPATVSRWERGFLPPVRELIRVAETLKIEPAELVEEQRPIGNAELLAEISGLREEIAQLRLEGNERRRKVPKA